MADPLLGSLIEGNMCIRLVRRIARGGFGVVYRGVLEGVEGFEKVIAVKTILERYSSHPEFIQLFVGEAKLVADLVHQNIVQIYQLGQVGPTYYMAMEYVAGVNLRQLLRRHKELKRQLPAQLAVFIASRICRGLEHAHRKRDADGRLLGVVHRDVSPPNLMISTEGEVKVTDFGIAKARNLMRDEEGTVLMGKCRYMSPEQARYQPTDHRSDLFALGIVLYELLTGRRPFDGVNQEEVLEALCAGRFDPPSQYHPEIPENVEEIVMRMLHPDITKRYQSASELGYELEYAIYHKGYGPTIVTLESYMKELFPKIFTQHPQEETEEVVSRETTGSPIAFLQRNLSNRTVRLEGQQAPTDPAHPVGDEKSTRREPAADGVGPVPGEPGC